MQNRRLQHHTLQVSNAQRSLEFYCHRLGMHIVGHAEGRGAAPDSYTLAFDEPQGAHLQLLCDRTESPIGYEHDEGDLYWKTGITLPDVNIARERLYFAGVEVSEPRQFRDVGYLCHLHDPDGYVIELLQHRFGASHQPCEPDPAQALGTAPNIGQITIRTRNPALSIPFYRDLLGMQLLSRQQVNPPGFTLYFLAFTEEAPPGGDVDSVPDREWLWQRPYTTIELQHIWGTEHEDIAYRTDEDGPLGFRGITIAADDRTAILRRARSFTFTVESPPASETLSVGAPLVMRDPDGTRVNIVDAG
jgi:catechol 2,3-dioxygenase-like lactoylglutathione lyase family enzyme